MGHEAAEVLIVGGGIAGSVLAILLGRKGFTVQLLERGQFPKDKPCGEGIMPAGVAVLQRLGVAEAIGGAPFHGVRYHFGGQSVAGRFPGPNSLTVGRGQRRIHLDQVLFREASATPGVTTCVGVCVEAPFWENGRVAGVVVDGEARRASLVVAADGVHSRMRHRLGLNKPLRRKRIGVRAHFGLGSGHENPPWVDVFVARGYEIYLTPLPNREILVACLADAEALEGTLDRAFHRWWQSQPAVAERLDGGKQISSLMSASPLAAKAQCGVAPGVVLLGDAAGFLDPITGGGMAQALMTAELLADQMPRRLRTGDEWLHAYERDRRAMLWDYSTLTRAVLWLADHPHLTEKILSVMRASPLLFSHLVGVAGGIRRLFDFRRMDHDELRSSSN